MNGKKSWFIVDGYRPPEKKGEDPDYVGHECIMVLNCNDRDATIAMDVFYADREPDIGIHFVAPGRRISTFRTSDEGIFGDVRLGIGQQYSLRITSDAEVIVQYGRLDVNQDNMAYMAVLGHAE
jgi:hypothetical protein